MTHTLDVAAGTIHYDEYGDPDAPPIVFVHGFAVDGQLWAPVAERLAAQGLRCIVPTWPFGSHREPLNPGTDLTPPGAARIVADFLAALDLSDVTIVANDSGGAVTQVLVTSDPSRIGRLVLTNCDAFENFPPGIFKVLSRAVRLPGAGFLLSHSMRSELVLRSRLAFGALNAARQPIELLRSWVAPVITDPRVRAEAMRFFGSMDARYTLAAAARLPELEMPALLVWGEDDTYFTLDYAERLEQALAQATLVRVPKAKTFVSLDQPDLVAAAIAAFIVGERQDHRA